MNRKEDDVNQVIARDTDAAASSDATVEPAPIPYELRIGVTGHRTLKNPQAVVAAVDSVLDHIEGTLNEASAHPRGPPGRDARPWSGWTRPW